jgi:hypothetical protein
MPFKIPVYETGAKAPVGVVLFLLGFLFQFCYRGVTQTSF